MRLSKKPILIGLVCLAVAGCNRGTQQGVQGQGEGPAGLAPAHSGVALGMHAQPLPFDPTSTRSLQEALDKKPDHAPILVRMAELARERGELSKSLDLWREVVELEPSNLQAQLELGRSLYEVGDVDGATRETEKILDADPRNIDALYNLGAIHANQGHARKALEYWRRAVEINPGSSSGRDAQRGIETLTAKLKTKP